jgi:adenosine deaminase
MCAYPLIDLHRHLEGSVRSSTILDIAVRDGHPFARTDRPRDLLVADGPLGGLLPYLAKVDDQIGVLATLADWRRAGREAVRASSSSRSTGQWSDACRP